MSPVRIRARALRPCRHLALSRAVAVVAVSLACVAPAGARAYLVTGTEIINGPGGTLAFADGILRSTQSTDGTRIYVEHGTSLSVIDAATGAIVLVRPALALPDSISTLRYEGDYAFGARRHPAGLFVSRVALATGVQQDLLVPSVNTDCVSIEMGAEPALGRLVMATRTEIVSIDIDGWAAVARAPLPPVAPPPAP